MLWVGGYRNVRYAFDLISLPWRGRRRRGWFSVYFNDSDHPVLPPNVQFVANNHLVAIHPSTEGNFVQPVPFIGTTGDGRPYGFSHTKASLAEGGGGVSRRREFLHCVPFGGVPASPPCGCSALDLNPLPWRGGLAVVFRQDGVARSVSFGGRPRTVAPTGLPHHSSSNTHN